MRVGAIAHVRRSVLSLRRLKIPSRPPLSAADASRSPADVEPPDGFSFGDAWELQLECGHTQRFRMTNDVLGLPDDVECDECGRIAEEALRKVLS